MSKTYEMHWDCEFCGSTKLLGKTHRHCPSCGAAQDPDRRYFPDDDEKVAVEDHEYIGADKICPSCEAPNAAKSACCSNCGSPLDGSKKVDLKQDPSTKLSSPEEASASGEHAPSSSASTKKSGLPVWLIAGGLLLVVGIILFSLKTEKEATITGHTWNRSIELERYQLVTKEAWKKDIPSDGRKKSCQEKQKGTEKIEDGQECSIVKKDNGDGTYKEKEECKTKYKEVPVYKKWCKYEINDWKVFDRVQEKGTDTTNLQWPVSNIRKCNIKALNCEREGRKEETYTLHFKDSEGEAHRCDVNQKKWTSMAAGTSLKLSFGKLTGNIDCSSL